MEISLEIAVDAAPVLGALESLAKLPLDVIQRFLDGIDGGFKSVCADFDILAAAGTGQYRAVLYPSDFLREFVTTPGTGDGDGIVCE